MDSVKTKPKVILLVGTERCGSTLFDMVMAAHSQIMGVGELAHYHKVLTRKIKCSCGQQISLCSFWGDILNREKYAKPPKLKMGFFNVIFQRVNKKSKKYASKKEYIEFYRDLYVDILKKSNADYVFDSSKSYKRLEIFLSSEEIEVIGLHLVRDGRGYIFSQNRRYGGYISHINEWVLRNLKISFVKFKHQNSKIYTITYDEFTQKPQDVVRRLLQDLGLGYEKRMLDFKNAEQHQVSGNITVRHNAHNNVIKTDDNWRYNLPKKYQFIFIFIAGWLNYYYRKRYGNFSDIFD